MSPLADTRDIDRHVRVRAKLCALNFPTSGYIPEGYHPLLILHLWAYILPASAITVSSAFCMPPTPPMVTRAHHMHACLKSGRALLFGIRYRGGTEPAALHLPSSRSATPQLRARACACTSVRRERRALRSTARAAHATRGRRPPGPGSHTLASQMRCGVHDSKQKQIPVCVALEAALCPTL